MEGVLMRSPNFWSMTVRNPEGELEVRAEPFRSVTRKNRFFRLPIVRGFLSLAETLWLGMKALTTSTNIALGEEEELSKKEIFFTMFVGLGLALVLFLAAPVLGTMGIDWLLGGIVTNALVFNIIEGALRIGVFIAYLVLISAFSTDIKRFFAYHGAEHKAIKVYERGRELIPQNARGMNTMHVRCGTSFVLYVLVASIFIFSLLPLTGWFLMVLSRIIVIPLVAGLAFEFIMWSARNQDNSVVQVLVWPGLQLQKLTTREPDDEMVEVAMTSLRKVLALEDEERTSPDGSEKLVI